MRRLLTTLPLFFIIGCGGGGNSSSSGNATTPTASATATAAPSPSPSPSASPSPTVTPSSSATPTPTATPTATPTPTPIDITLHELVNDIEAQEAVRFLTQSTFGPTEQSIAQLVTTELTYETWLNQQIEIQQSFIQPQVDDRIRLGGLDPLDKTNVDHAYRKMMLASDVIWETFVYGDDQLRQKVAFALSQIFVISDVSDTLFHDIRGITNYHDMLASHAFGNFRNLLEDVTLHPMMGEYLSMIRNEKADEQRNIRPDENYARELMQLFSIGLVQLNDDGSVQTDVDGQPIPTYDQDIIKAFASVFTGWMYGDAPTWYWRPWTASSEIIPMRAFEQFHDTQAKTLLNGQVIPANQTAQQDLDDALDNIFNHQNLAPFISKQLIQRLVTSNPSLAYVSRVSAVFNNNGEGVKGDLEEVIKAILLDDEARSGHLSSPASFGKLKDPLLKFTALMRAFDVSGEQAINESGSETLETIRFLWTGYEIGQRPYGAPSVFNFFRPDYSPAGEIRDQGLVSPELQILNESYITAATNRGSQIIFNSYDFLLEACQENLDYSYGTGCLAPDFSDELAIANNTEQLIDHINILLFAGQMSEGMQSTLAIIINQQSQDIFKVAEAIHLAYISPEFAVQR